MRYSLLLSSEATSDLKISYEWYQEKRIGLGDEFLEEVDECFDKITSNPDHYSFINSDYRYVRVKRFPFILVYEIEGKTVIVNAVRHTKRDAE